MRHLAVVALGSAVFVAAAAEARGPQLPARLPTFAGPMAPTVRSPHYSTRMAFNPRTSRSNIFIAAVPVSQNATIGIGRFYAMPRRRPGQNQPVMSEGKRQRRAAVGLSLKF